MEHVGLDSYFWGARCEHRGKSKFFFCANGFQLRCLLTGKLMNEHATKKKRSAVGEVNEDEAVILADR